MKKATSYFEDDVYAKMKGMAIQNKRSFNEILNMIVEEALNSSGTDKSSSSAIEMPEDVLEDVKAFAEIDRRTVDQMAVILMQQAIKEKKRLREKYLKSLKEKI